MFTLSGFRPTLLRTVLEGDEWLSYIENWRDHDGTKTTRNHLPMTRKVSGIRASSERTPTLRL